MPDYDGTGPSGEGSLTGRKRGRCRGSLNKENKKKEDPSGRKFGFRRGRRNNGGGRRRGEQGPGQRPGG